MPETVKQIALQWNDSLNVTVYAPGGTGFVNHIADNNVYQHFARGGWDYVVLQPGSNESPGYSFPINETITKGKTLIDSIYKYSPCAQVIFYEISYGVADNSAQAKTNYLNTQTLIKANIMKLADSANTYLCPAGEVMRNLWQNKPADFLWGSFGDIHPNALGSYAIACSFASTIFKKRVKGIKYYAGLDTTKCNYAQQLSDSVVFTNTADWRFKRYKPFAHFSFTTSRNTVTFINNSAVYDSLKWDFGNGTNSKLVSPAPVIYASTGTYKVKLVTYKNGCMNEYDTTVVLKSANSVQSINNNQSTFIYPNPALNEIRIHSSGNGRSVLKIYNLEGKLVKAVNDADNDTVINIADLKPAVYVYQLIGEGGRTDSGKLMIGL